MYAPTALHAAPEGAKAAKLIFLCSRITRRHYFAIRTSGSSGFRGLRAWPGGPCATQWLPFSAALPTLRVVNPSYVFQSDRVLAPGATMHAPTA